ncbi:MAG: TolC family protein [Acidobacteriota bacterium]
MKKILVLAFIITGILSINVYNQEKTLSLDELISLALERNPKIKSIKNLVEAKKFRVTPEKTLPDPVIGFNVKNIGIDRFSVGEEMMSGIGFSFFQIVPFPGKLQLKGEIATKRALQTEESLKAETLSLIKEIKELYSRLFYYNKAIEILTKKKEILEKGLKLAEVKYAVGKGIQSDVFKAQVEISKIEEMIIPIREMIRIVRANINSVLDFPPERPVGIPEEIQFYELKIELNKLYEEAMKKSPVLREAELIIDENFNEVELAKKEFYPNFMVQGGKDFKGPFKDMYEIMVGIEVPLYYKKKQANLLSESLSKLSSSKNSYTSMKNEIYFMLNDNFIMAKTSENLIELYKDRIIPQATLTLESSLANYQVDRVDFLTLLSDINNLFTYEMDYFKELSNLWISTAKIEELTSLEIIK